MNANQQKLLDFLQKSPSYLKSKRQTLADKFELTITEVIEAFKYFKSASTSELISEPENISTINQLQAELDIDPNKWDCSTWRTERSAKGEYRMSASFKQRKPESDTFSINSVLQGVETLKWNIEPFKPIPTTSANMLVICLTDIHVFTQSALDEIPSEELILPMVESMLENAFKLDCSCITILGGHDFFNSDHFIPNKGSTTTAGTLQYDTLSWKESFTRGIEILSKIIQRCLTYSDKVTYINVNANHDEHKSYAATCVLEKIFDQVKFEKPDMYSKISFGNSAILAIHEIKGANKATAAIVPQYLQVVYPEAFSHKFKYVLTGHLHNKNSVAFLSSKETFGVRWIQTPALTVTTKWALDNGYIGNTRSITGLVFHPQKGLIAELSENHRD